MVGTVRCAVRGRSELSTASLRPDWRHSAASLPLQLSVLMKACGIVFPLLGMLFASHSLGQTQPQSAIEGTIRVSPAHPGPIREGVPNSRPLTNFTFVVENENGAVTEFTTDAEGHFRVAVPPGHYTVSRKEPKRGLGHFGPFQVDVTAGQTAKVEWQCDSGMR